MIDFFLGLLHPCCEPVNEMIGNIRVDILDMLNPSHSGGSIPFYPSRWSIKIKHRDLRLCNPAAFGNNTIIYQSGFSRCPSGLHHGPILIEPSARLLVPYFAQGSVSTGSGPRLPSRQIDVFMLW